MHRVTVVSQAISTVGYDAESRTLEIEFATGGRYHYFDVPEDVFRDMLTAPSKGRYFHDVIDGSYRFREV